MKLKWGAVLASNSGRILIPIDAIAQRIFVIRKQRVMLDADLAELYGVETKVLKQAVKRNIVRFPAEFVFQLTQNEKLKVVTNCDHLDRLKYSAVLPQAFTEHGALMLGNVLKSARAIEVSLLVVRTFVRLRELLSANKDLAVKVDELERKLIGHDKAILNLVTAIKELMTTPQKKKRSIGFTADFSKNEA